MVQDDTVLSKKFLCTQQNSEIHITLFSFSSHTECSNYDPLSHCILIFSVSGFRRELKVFDRKKIHTYE